METSPLSESPLVVGIGGTVRATSTSEAALRTALAASAAEGARTICLTADDIMLPFYDPSAALTPQGARLVRALREADALVVASPGYHGGISGLVKNALDYAEELAQDSRPYLDGLPIGCISVAYGKQAAVTVLEHMRTVAHALRGFPTPYGASVVAAPGTFQNGRCADADVRNQLERVGQQVVALAQRTRAQRTGTPEDAFETVA